MSRKISQAATNAFYSGKNFSLQNTRVENDGERLRALGINVSTKRGTAYYDGKEISDFGYIDSGLFA